MKQIALLLAACACACAMGATLPAPDLPALKLAMQAQSGDATAIPDGAFGSKPLPLTMAQMLVKLGGGPTHIVIYGRSATVAAEWQAVASPTCGPEEALVGDACDPLAAGLGTLLGGAR